MNTLIAIAAAFSVIASLVAVVVVFANLRFGVDALNKQEERLTGKHEKMLQDYMELLVLVKSFISQQAVVNQNVADTLKALMVKLEKSDQAISHSGSALSLLAEVLQNKRIVEVGG
jgi:hypothetical protein